MQSSYVIAQASPPLHRIVRNTDMAVFRTGDVSIVKHRLNNLIRAAAITTSFATAAQSCLHSHCRAVVSLLALPRSRVFTRHCRTVVFSLALPRSRVFTRHCRAVVSSLATPTQSCLHSPLPRSRVFTRHCQWSTETLHARDTMSTIYVAATKRGHILPTEALHVYW